MEHLAEQFVQERNRRGSVGRGRRVEEDLRWVAVRFALWNRERGGDLADSAARLGVAGATLDRWLKARPPVEPTLRQVVLRDELQPAEIAARGLTLVTPDGFRVEGLDAAELASLLGLLR